jgi:hypothetical protein
MTTSPAATAWMYRVLGLDGNETVSLGAGDDFRAGGPGLDTFVAQPSRTRLYYATRATCSDRWPPIQPRGGYWLRSTTRP